MQGQEGEELRHVASVGFRRIVGEMALDAKISEPVIDRLADIGRGLNGWRLAPLHHA